MVDGADGGERTTAHDRVATWLVPVKRILAFRGRDGRGASLGQWLLVLAISYVVCRALAFAEPFVLLVPPALTLAVVLPALSAGARTPDGRRILRWAEPVLVGAGFAWLAAWVWGAVLRGLPIDSGDHQIMAARAEAFTEALRHGRWLHWTHMMQGGDSLVDFYPIFVSLLTGIAHILFARSTTPFVYTYSVIVVFGWWLRGVATYHLARRFAPPAISLAIALAQLFEVGKDVWDGVWNGTIYWGMIHNNVALSIATLAAAAQIDTARRATSRNVVKTAVWMAISAFAHPLGIIFGTLTTAAALGSALLGTGNRRRALWAFAATALGLAIAAVWILPFTHALRSLGFSNALPGETWEDMSKGLLSGDLPTSSFGAFIGFGVVAVVAALGSRRIPILIPALVAVLLWLLALTPLMVQVRILDFFPSFLEGQQRRMLTVLKTASVPALAWALARIFSAVRVSRGSFRIADVLARTVLLGLLVYGPGRAIFAGFADLKKDLVAQNPRKSPAPSDRPHAGADHEALFRWIKDKRASDPSPTPWRVAILWDHRMAHAAWGEGFHTGVPVVDFVNVPANFLTVRPREKTVDGYHDWNIRYAITDTSKAPCPGATKITTEGSLTLWEIPHYDDRFVVAPPPVKISGLALDGDDIRFHVEGAPPEGVDVTVRAAWFPRWRAEESGKRIDVTAVPPHPKAKPKQEQLGLHVTNGDVVIRCNGPMPRFFAGLFVSLVGVAATVYVGAEARRRRVAEIAERLGEQAREHLVAIRSDVATWLEPWGRRIAIAAAATIALAVPIVRGSGKIAFPVIEGVGLSVTYRPAGGEESRCDPFHPIPSYTCPSGALVTPALGVTARHDDTGEFGILWTGIRVEVGDKGSVVTLHFPRFHSGARDVWMKASTWGAFRVSGTYAGAHFGPIEVDGESSFALPLVNASTGPLDLEFEGKIPHANLVVAKQ